MGRRIGVPAVLVISSSSTHSASWREIDKRPPSIVAGAGGLAIDSCRPVLAPVRIVVSGLPGSQRFTLAWCAFIPPGGTGSFSIEVTKGNLQIR